MKLSDSERLYKECIPVPEAGCWLWTGWVNQGGYGRLSRNKKMWLAHRLSWTLSKGEIPAGLCVCHKCDTRRCINPDHLFLGTYADNFDDMASKGRNIFGERQGTAILTDEKVLSIAQCTLGVRDASRLFGIAPQTINNIRKGWNWNHITGLPKRIRTDRPRKSPVLTGSEVKS